MNKMNLKTAKRLGLCFLYWSGKEFDRILIKKI